MGTAATWNDFSPGWRDVASELVQAACAFVAGMRPKTSERNGSAGAEQGDRMLLTRGPDRLHESLAWAAHEILMGYSSYVIGQPHQELVPWCGWLRAVQVRHLPWLQAWPDEDYLHP